MTSVYVSGLPHYVKDWDLRNYFRKCGRVVSVRLNPGQRTGLRSGFVNFADEGSVEQALSNRHPVFLGRRIHVSSSSAAAPPPNPYGPPIKREPPPPPKSNPTQFVQVKTEARSSAEPPPPSPVVIKQEPGVLRPEMSSADPFRTAEFTVSTNPFDSRTPSKSPQVAAVFGKTETSHPERQEERSKPMISSSRSVNKKPIKRPLFEEPKEKSKKKVMMVGKLKLPRSAAEFVEANKKHFQEKAHDRSPEEELPPEIVEEKERIVGILNSGSSEKLQRLQLIGKKKAEAIIAYRRLRGKFRKVEDLAKISLFGEQFMQRFKEANFLV